MSNNKVINSWDWDIRVRERNLRNGVLTDKDVEKQRGSLPDLADQADAVTLAQPALAGSGLADLSDDDVGADDESDTDLDDAGPASEEAPAANGSSATSTNVAPSSSNVSEGS